MTLIERALLPKVLSAVADVYIEPCTLFIISSLVHSFQQDSSEPDQNKNGILFYLQSRTE